MRPFRQIDILEELREAVSFDCDEPAQAVQRIGRTLLGLGQALEGRPEQDIKDMLLVVLKLSRDET